MKTAVMYGAGNIGRGFIGDLFSRSGYQVVFIDIDTELIEGLNRDNAYPLRIVSNEGEKKAWIRGVCGIDGRDREKAAQAIACADIMATAVGVHVLPRIAPVIAQGLKLRWQRAHPSPLNIIICENMLDAHHYLREQIAQALNQDEEQQLKDTVGLVEASIGRMVPVMTKEMKDLHPLMVCVEPYDHLPVDRDAFIGDIPSIVNMQPRAPFDFYIQRKLYMHNMSHGAAAYFGHLAGYQYIWEAVGDPVIKILLLRACREASMAMAREHHVSCSELLDYADNIIYRFGNRKLGDTIERVGRDPVRKLSPKDRLVGAANLCLRQDIIPIHIAAAIAAGFVYRNEEDDSATAVQDTIKTAGIGEALKKFSNLSEGPLAELIDSFYVRLRAGASLHEILAYAEQMKNSRYNGI